MALSVSNAAGVAAGNFVAAIVDGGTAHRFINAAGTPLNGIANSLPTVKSITQVADPQGTADGGWKVVLTPAAVDTVNGSSVMSYVLDQNAYFILASTNNG